MSIRFSGREEEGKRKTTEEKLEKKLEGQGDQSAVYKLDELLYTKNPGKLRSPPRLRKERAAMYTVRGAGGRWLLRARRRRGRRSSCL